MAWLQQTLETLSAKAALGYLRDDGPAAEPTAWAALALISHNRHDAAQVKLRWLAGQQANSGSVGVRAGCEEPRWPTSLAVLAWKAAELAGARPAGATCQASQHFPECARRGVEFLLTVRGTTQPPNAKHGTGHNSLLAGWPWVEGTHSWVEPTALAVLALKACGHGAHARTREAICLLMDRLLPGGGCNYGNTIVMGQYLVPQPLPTALALLALADEKNTDPRVARSLEYLRAKLSARTAPASLAAGLLALKAHRIWPPAANDWLKTAADRAQQSPGYAALALVALAAGNLTLPLSNPPAESTAPRVSRIRELAPPLAPW